MAVERGRKKPRGGSEVGRRAQAAEALALHLLIGLRLGGLAERVRALGLSSALLAPAPSTAHLSSPCR
jgi:hypothetical protein